MTFFQTAIDNNHEAMYNIQKDMSLLKRLFSFKLFKTHFEQCCGGTYAVYCKSQDPLFFSNLCELKESLGLGTCGEWNEEIASTFDEYQQLLKELDDVKDQIQS